MSTSPLISVIIPCYNYGRFLPDACESLLAQSMTDWECILVNNGRFPETEIAARSYVNRDRRFVYLESDAMGPSPARNEGLKVAKGKFVQFLDADDKLDAGRFLVMSAQLKNDPGLDLIYSDVKYFSDENTSAFYDSLNELSSEGKGGHAGSGKEMYNRLIRKNIFVINSPLVKKEVLDTIGGFLPDFHYLEDWDLWLRASSVIKKFQYVGDARAVAYVRSHTTSLSQNKNSMRSHFLPVLLTNTHYSRLTLMNIFFVYVIASEFIVASIFSGEFKSVWKMLISTAKSFENYLKILLHFLLLPLYLPIYIVLKLYRKFK